MLRDPATLASLAVISLATLTPGSGEGGWRLGPPDLADLLVNVALFAPLGAAVRRTRFRRADQPSRSAGQARPALLVASWLALAVSAGIELAQLALIPGRDSSPWDLLANTLGAGLGAALPTGWLATPLPLAWLASGWLLAPAPPPTAQWWGQWAHPFGSPVLFSGAIQTASLNRLDAPEGPLGEATTAQMRSEFASPALHFDLSLLPPSRPSPRRLQVAGIADGAGGEVIGLWQLGWDLELRWHARGTRWGLRHPAIRAPGLLQDLPQAIATISSTLETGHAFVEVNSTHRFGLRLGPWEGWRLLWPGTPPPARLSGLLSVLWTVGCVGLPLTLFAIRSRRSHGSRHGLGR